MRIFILVVYLLVVEIALNSSSHAASILTGTTGEALTLSFTSVKSLSTIPITDDTGEKPQAKVWTYAGKHWAVLASSDGTNLWRLDGTTWTSVLRLSTKTSSKADCKLVGNNTHIFLYQGRSSQLVSVEYNSSTGTYQLWSKRTSTVGISLDAGVETATIDMDSRGRMWLASAGTTSAYVRWSDSPYNKWSAPITVSTGITDDDICAVVALPGKVGVFWSNQTTQRFGFKTHVDGDDPAIWSTDEVPASQSAMAIGVGMSDDHMNIVAAGDGTLYCAVKTGYDTKGYPAIALLVRRPAGTWDNLYEVNQYTGTRPIVVLNESMSKVRVVYTTATSAGNIVYRESPTSSISFGSQFTLISGAYNDATSTKMGFNAETVVMASNTSQAVSVLVSDESTPTAPSAPVLASPSYGATGVSTAPSLSWNASTGANTYQAQVSTSSSFSSTVFDKSGLTSTSTAVAGLASGTLYYWRARATNSAGSSAWSAVWSFTTAPAEPTTNNPLVAYWKMDEGSGTNLLDASTYGNNAPTTGGPTWVAGVNGQAIRFNGTSQNATAADNASLDITNAITLATWIKPEKKATQYVIKKAEQNSVDGYELSLSSSGNIFFRFNQKTSADNYRVNSTVAHPTNGTTWMHVAVTYDGGVMRMYINGVLNASRTVTPALIKTNALALTIGAGNNGYRGFQGAMDELRIYNTALSASDISALANGSTTPTLASVPVLASPSNGATGVSTAPSLSWNASTGANTYQAQVSTSSSFSSTVFDRSGLTTTSASVSSLVNSTVYYWRARATNSAGTSAWSAVWSFTTAPAEPTPTAPSAPVLASPSNGATGVSTAPSLSWSASTGADSYQAQVSTSSSFSSTVFDKSGLTSTSTAVAGLASGTLYYWRARAINSAGSSAWSTVWSFTTAPAEPTSDGTLIAFNTTWKYLDDGSNQGTAWKATFFNDAAWKSGTGKFGYGISDAATVVSYGPDPNNKYVTTYYRKSFSITDVTALSDFKISAKRDDGIIVYVNGTAVWRTGFPSGTVYYNTLAYESKDNGTTVHTISVSSSPFKTGTNVIAVEVHQAALNSPDMAFDLQLSATGSLTATNTSSALVAAPHQDKEMEEQLIVYPNPFSSTATINFTLPEDGEYSLILFDSKGAMVSALKQGRASAGETNRVDVDGSKLVKGLYIIRLQTRDYIKTQRLVLER